MPYRPVLAIVIPVYNEEQRLPLLLRDWQPVFKATGVPYKLILIDDGSKDKSLELLRKLAGADPSLEIHSQPNAGHGPAILNGYRVALGSGAEWTFQIDSDHQLETEAFRELWMRRADYDLLLGQRQDKNASQGRQWVSLISKAFVRILYGKGVTDVNSPYRLMRSCKLGLALEKVPADSFAPNVLLTSWFIREKSRIFVTVVRLRAEGLRRSRLNRYFLVGALRSAIQTILFRIR